MLVLLPPSEGQATPAAGDPVDLATLAFPQLVLEIVRGAGMRAELHPGGTLDVIVA